MKTILLLCTAVFAASFAVAYDFSDPDFNRLLEEELTEIAEERDIYVRNRREADEDEGRAEGGPDDDSEDGEGHPPFHKHHCKKHKMGCCGKSSISTSIAHFSKNRTMKIPEMTECFDEVNQKLGNKTFEDDADMFSCEKVKRMKKRHICFHACMAKKFEVADESGILDIPKVKTLLESRLNETWQKDLVFDAVDTCSKMKFDETWKDDTEEYKCNPQPLQFEHCVWKQVEIKCPQDQQNQGRHCKKLRSKLTTEKPPSAS